MCMSCARSHVSFLVYCLSSTLISVPSESPHPRNTARSHTPANMETLHKLAGVQDASDLQASSASPPPQPTVVAASTATGTPPPVPEKDDVHNNSTTNLSRRASRASLPLNRQPSHKSFRSSKHNLSRSHSRASAVGVPDDYPPAPTLNKEIDVSRPQSEHRHQSSRGTSTASEDFAWGPSHPCFPHPNPHCRTGSQEALETRVIRVRRDWLASGDLYPQFANLYPEILDPLVTDSEFRMLIATLNNKLRGAFDPFSTRAYVDAVVGVLTGYLWEDAGMTGSKKGAKGIDRWLEEWNRGKAREGRAVRVVQAWETGFMGLDFVVPDPGIDGDTTMVGEGEEEHGEGL